MGNAIWGAPSQLDATTTQNYIKIIEINGVKWTASGGDMESTSGLVAKNAGRGVMVSVDEDGDEDSVVVYAQDGLPCADADAEESCETAIRAAMDEFDLSIFEREAAELHNTHNSGQLDTSKLELLVSKIRDCMESRSGDEWDDQKYVALISCCPDVEYANPVTEAIMFIAPWDQYYPVIYSWSMRFTGDVQCTTCNEFDGYEVTEDGLACFERVIEDDDDDDD